MRNWVAERVSITRQKVTFAKAFVLQHFSDQPKYLLRAFLKAQCAWQYEPGSAISIRPEEAEPTLAPIPDYISWYTACCQAIAELLAHGVLLPRSSGMEDFKPVINYSTGHQPGTLDFSEHVVVLPSQIRRPPTADSQAEQPLTDADLYLNQIDIPNLDPNVEMALREAVACFRHELFTPCVVMLGKASEGAWIGCGLALCDKLPGTHTKSRTTLLDPRVSLRKKIETVVKLCERPEFKDVTARTGVKPAHFNTVQVWSECVQDSRNAVHANFSPALPNSYSKTAALLIGAVPQLKTLYRIMNAL